MALLSTITADREQFDRHPGLRAVFSRPLTGTGVITFILKGAWAAARLGKLMLSDYKRALVEAASVEQLFDALFVLLAIGTRTEDSRAEIATALHRAPSRPRIAQVPGPAVQSCCEVTAQLLDATAEKLDVLVRFIGEGCLEPGVDAVAGPIREELIRTLPLMAVSDGVTDDENFLSSLSLVAATARGAPEQFYLPGELVRARRRPWTPAATWMMLGPLLKSEAAARKPGTEPAPISRQGPCLCGSGKKYKRCCGT